MQLQGADAKVHEALARGELEEAGLDTKEHALLAYIKKLTLEPARLNGDDAQKLRDQGWTDPEMAEAVYIGSIFAFFNRVADAFGLEDPNYFALKERGETKDVPRQ